MEVVKIEKLFIPIRSPFQIKCKELDLEYILFMYLLTKLILPPPLIVTYIEFKISNKTSNSKK